MRVLIRRASVITARGRFQADVLVEDEVIREIADRIAPRQPVSVIDADGMYLLPGAVDPHVHMSFPFGRTVSVDGFRSGSSAALAGGTTTFLDFAFPGLGQPLREAVAARKAEADREVLVDYGLHCIVREVTPTVLAEIPSLISGGTTSFKVFTTYDEQGLRLNPGDLVPLFRVVAESGGLVNVHAEEPSIVNRATEELVNSGKRQVKYYPMARPVVAESAMVAVVIELAEETGCPIYFHHVSTARTVDLIGWAKARGQRVYAETCPHYLLLDASVYDRADGVNYAVTPPLRTQADQDRLWTALRDGVIDTVGTDHCPFNRTQKATGMRDFTRIPNGLPGVESRLALIHSAGVVRGRVSLGRWVDACCTAPATIFGLTPRKGDVQPGGDADLVLFDPGRRTHVRAATHHSDCDWDPYEDWEVTGAAVLTMRRGQVVWQDGHPEGTGRGRFVPRGRPPTLGNAAQRGG